MNRAFLLLTSLVTNKLLTIILLRTSLRSKSLRSLFSVNQADNRASVNQKNIACFAAYYLAHYFLRTKKACFSCVVRCAVLFCAVYYECLLTMLSLLRETYSPPVVLDLSGSSVVFLLFTPSFAVTYFVTY